MLLMFGSSSYRSFEPADNLLGLDSLVKLALDNNILEKIEGISHLTRLEWLDLSFNNISVIEGLSTLTNLEDLSLSNNRIERLENLDTLVKLNLLSIGKWFFNQCNLVLWYCFVGSSVDVACHVCIRAETR